MIKQELDMLKEIGFIGGFNTKKQVIEFALLDCENSLQESYDLIKATINQDSDDTKQVLNNITISLTILKLMTKESY